MLKSLIKLIFICVFIFNGLNVTCAEINTKGRIQKTYITAKSETISDSILSELLSKHEIHHPEIVICQAYIETGNYKSKLCRQHKNLFGIKLKGRYAHFKSYEDCVIAYKNFIQKKYRQNEDYYKFLKRIRYAQNPKYISELKKISRKKFPSV